MDHSRPMPPDTTTDVPGKALPLPQEKPERKPYQAYCETVTSSSRSSSLDSLVPRPLRISRAPLLHINFDSEPPDNHEFDHNTSLVQAVASVPESSVEHVTLLKTEKEGKAQTIPTNCDTLADGAISNHITRVITPRGNHSLASDGVTACDIALSHLRIQQLGSPECVMARTIPRRPILQETRHSRTYSRPLPPLPPEEDPFQDDHTLEEDAHDEEGHEQGFRRAASQIATLIPGCLKRTRRARRRLLPSPYDSVQVTEPKEDIALETLQPSDSLKPPLRPYMRDSNSVPRQDVLYGRAQSIAADASHVPRGHWPNVDSTHAPRRTQPKDAKPKYPYIQLPSQAPDIPPPTPPHRTIYTQPADHSAQTAAVATTPSFRSSLDISKGPRPPPWGSYDNLELQRRQRSEARASVQTHGVRSTTDSALTYQKSHSTDSLGKGPARAIEEYREQILGVYPDMAFDGEASKGERGCCCCVLM